MKVIVYRRPDSGVSVVYPVINTIGEESGMTEEKALERAMKKLPKDAYGVSVIDASLLPDRAFRDAWRWDGSTLDIDMVKARAIHRKKLRAMRDPLLASLDVEYMRADEAGDQDKKRAIAGKKQALRDVTSYAAIDAASTPEELKDAIPPELK